MHRLPLDRRLTTLLLTIASLSLVPTASAHEGTVHGGVPHVILLTLLVIGLGVLGATALRDRFWQRFGSRLDPRLAAVGLLVGVSMTALGVVGLVELQVEPIGTTPLTRVYYPVLTFFGGMGIALASLVLYHTRWGDHHAYPVLGTLLGLWVAYPQLLPRGTVFHPLGYVLVLAVPVVLGYIVWTEVVPALARTGRRARTVGALAGLGFTAFFVVSSGLLSFNPEDVPPAQGEAFTVVTEFTSPLVMWPAIELYRPSIPLFAAVSVGTALVVVVLAGLVTMNATLGVATWRARSADDGPAADRAATDGGTVQGVTGALATTGATACCCCGPAIYGVASAAFGASASPLYWAFTDPESPLATVFLVGAIALLTANAVTLSAGVDEACER
ncbi:hypothetical protein [Haloarchaeobius sp. DYHT-AS-18]|uniref:hypothetical protein n=1 Tax=Haloarchaeobius sp. DYHT-AS-18 TaxID=3446117 RepID=UPI003EC0FEDB